MDGSDVADVEEGAQPDEAGMSELVKRNATLMVQVRDRTTGLPLARDCPQLLTESGAAALGRHARDCGGERTSGDGAR
jgi:hypothetical protein